jgi:lipoprotein signal peptidase
VRDLQAAGGTPLTSQPAGEPDRPEETGASRSTSPRIAILIGVALLVLVLDIISKTIVVATLSDRAPLRLLGGLLTLRESRNPGAAFSIGGTSTTILFTAIAVGVVIFIVRASRRIYSLAWAIALGLLLGGAMGNLTDRIFRSPAPFRGWVVDWIQVPHWPVFNLADSAICCGGALMVLLAARGHGIEGTSRPVQPSGPPAQPERPRPSQPDQPHPSGGGGG